MRSAVRTVAEILSDDRGLSLPYFQRGYAWRGEHCERLFGDLVAGMDGKYPIDWYPLGTITVSTPGAGSLAIADGQQRLTTLTILIALLRDFDADAQIWRRLNATIMGGPEGIGGPELRLRTNGSASRWLRDYVQRAGATEKPWNDEDDIPEAAQTLLRNRDIMRRLVAALTPTRRHVLANFLLERCFFNVLEVDSEDAARLLFTTMHDRGLKPNEVDLFKSEVLDPIGPEAREDCQMVWEDVEARLGVGGMATLMRQIAVIRGRTMSTAPVEVQLRDLYKISTAAGAQELVETAVGRHGPHLAEIRAASLGANPAAGESGRRLQYLRWVRNHDTWHAPALHWLAVSGETLAAAAPFLRRLEALAWTQMILAVQSNHRDARYLRLMKEIDAGRAMMPGSALDLATRERNEVARILGAPNITRRPYKLFLLLRLCGTVEGDHAVSNLPPATIEHIFPNSPGAASRWQQDFPDPSEAKDLRNSLGNLTLLTVEEQNGAGNKDYAEKRGVLAESVFPLSRDAASAATWTPADVQARTARMVQLLMRSWGISH